MKIQIASDLHLEGTPSHMPDDDAFRPMPDRDVLILAGDIGINLLAAELVRRELETSPVIYVPGNHEYYAEARRADVDANWTRLAERCPDLHYLIANGVTLDGVRFWGAPWYSDLWGVTPHDSFGTRYWLEVTQGISDFNSPWNGDVEWTLARHVNHHQEQTELLAAQAGQVDVVITHWPPTKAAIHPKFAGDLLNSYFINDREDLVRAIGAKLWISGHTHEAYDYEVGPTRCNGNPTGYSREYRQSGLFRPDRVLEI